ncbi:MAG: DUF72 domain-containing protein [Armatimonadetes bacterium]|nr:DUF72 domain-containing protein [Armatimonadota bacterium]
MIRIGTSGFSYEDWRGHFYPPDLPKRDMLPYYARFFPTVEINATYYSLPSPFTFMQMARKVPEGFDFVVKAHKTMTHAGEYVPEAFEGFRRAVSPLTERNMLGCVLAQFPWSFRYAPENLAYLRQLRDGLADLPTVVEFRNRAWVRDETFATLRDLGLGFCCVDEPRLKGLMPPVCAATSPLGYIRFHGRNAAKWWQHEQAYERYDYLYSEAELAEWVPKIRALEAQVKRVYLFFNNHYEGKAGQNARMLARLLNLALPLAEGDAARDALTGGPPADLHDDLLSTDNASKRWERDG